MKDYKAEQKMYRAMAQPVRVAELSKPPSQRKQKRQRIIDRKFTKQGYKFGRLIGGREDGLVNHIIKKRLPETK